MSIKRLTVGSLQANCYLLSDEPTSEVAIIDPGDDADFIIQTILSGELTAKAIIATHGHFDHVLAALELKLTWRIPFYMHRKDEFLLARMDTTAKHFINFDPGPPPDVDIYLKDNSALKIGNLELTVIHTPGHTPGSVSLYSKHENALFVGDLIFADGSQGATVHKYSDHRQLTNSIGKIKKLPGNAIIYPGHGESFMLKDVILERNKVER